jgi:ATP-binding cassette subfamily B protein
MFYDRSANELIMDKLLFFAIAASKALPTINQLYTSIVLTKTSTISLNEVSNEIENLAIETKKNKIIREDIVFKNSLTLKNVNFKFDKGNFKFDNLNLNLNKNDCIGICGPSGSGKTTLIDLISGIYKPQKGSLQIDGKIITENTIDSYRDLISYISQDNYIGDLTIKEAVILGNIKNNEINLKSTDDKVRQSLEKVELLTFVNSLPNNINTKLGDNGIKLSGGQRQRLTLAKVFFTQSEILILDESTSAIDQQTEEKILDKIYHDVKKNNQTLIFVTHRLKSLQKTDKVILLQDSKIKFAGDYSDLIDNTGNYL